MSARAIAGGAGADKPPEPIKHASDGDGKLSISFTLSEPDREKAREIINLILIQKNEQQSTSGDTSSLVDDAGTGVFQTSCEVQTVSTGQMYIVSQELSLTDSENHGSIKNHCAVTNCFSVDRYISVVENMERGEHVAIKDSFERSVAIAFELVLNYNFDPWDIDLGRFVKLYAEKLNKESVPDLAIAGKLVSMAFSILKLKSDTLVLKACPPEPVQPEATDAIDDYYGEDDFGMENFTDIVLGQPKAPIDESILYKGERKVTFIDLLNAFEEARQEVEREKLIDKKREDFKASQNFRRMQAVKGMVHREDINQDIGLTYSRILSASRDDLILEDIWQRTKLDYVTLLMSLMFLAFYRKVSVFQEKIGMSSIHISLSSPSEDPKDTHLNPRLPHIHTHRAGLHRGHTHGKSEGDNKSSDNSKCHVHSHCEQEALISNHDYEEQPDRPLDGPGSGKRKGKSQKLEWLIDYNPKREKP
ncbi:MAG: hypothetical protein QW728_07435 [Thermoplasmata archaeon]